MAGVSTVSAGFRTIYQDEFKMDFERNVSKLKLAVNTNGVIHGDTVKWDVASTGDEATTRGRNGNIPEGEQGQSQVSATLQEHFSSKKKIDKFDEFRNNPNVRSIHYQRAQATLWRSVDQVIIDALDASASTLSSGNGSSGTAAGLSTLANVDTWLEALLNNDVPSDDGNIFAVISVRASLLLQKIAEFKSHDYVDYKPIPDMPGARMLQWQGIKWITFNGLTGKTTNSCKMYLFHSSAIGHLLSGDPEMHAYYYEPQDRWETYGKIMHCAKTCLSRGVIRWYHDDTASL